MPAIVTGYVALVGAVCLAVLRRDGFVSVDSDKKSSTNKEGRLTTRPFALQGDRLFVNVAVRKNGQLLTEMLNEKNEVVATSKPIQRDARRAHLEWSQGNLAELTGQVVSLRFTLRAAGLYSYWVH